MGRVVFHVNPSSDMKNLLLPGTVEPPGRVLVVNYTQYTQMPALNREQARQMFTAGDSTDGSETLSMLSGGSQVLKKPEDKAVSPSMFKCRELGDGRKPGASSGSDIASSFQTENSSLNKVKSPKQPEKAQQKSRLPVPTKKVLQSSLAQYFQRPVSAPGDNARRQVKSAPRPLPEMKRAPAVTTIPRPLGRNAGKLEGGRTEK